MPTPAHRVNAAIRDLASAARVAELADDEAGIDELVAGIEAVTRRLEERRVDGVRMQATLRMDPGAAPPPVVTVSAAASDTAGAGLGVEDYLDPARPTPEEIFPFSPVIGPLHPHAAPVRLWRARGEGGGELHGEAVLGALYNGPPDSVHGGVIAEVFDELLGCVCVTRGLGGFTGTLTVVYRSTTPLDTRLQLRGWVERTEGRKVFARGTIHAGDRLCAEAEGIFIRSESPPPPSTTW